MCKMKFIKTLSILLCGCLFPISPAFAGETVTCKSNDFRYQYCRVPTGNRVSLDRQRSTTRCRLGDTWGYDRNGIWVDRGCAADFRVAGRDWENDRDRYDDRYRDKDRDRDKHHDDKNKALAVGAGIVGIGLLAAIAANGQNSRTDVSSWSVGTFKGYDDYERTNVEVTILPGGSVSGFAGSSQFSGSVDGNRLQAGKHRFNISPSGNGFMAIDEENSGHRVMFQRTGAGY